jgi:phage N-6-adenine-methyltransferase
VPARYDPAAIVSVPQQRPHRSRQNYRTPLNFLAAAKHRLGIQHFAFDFAADAQNAVARRFWSRQDDALSHSAASWAFASGSGGWGWLNPEFTKIGPWARKCVECRAAGGRVALLVPASIGADWYRDHVHNQAYVLALNGRLAFIRNKPRALYPKDCILCLYSPETPDGFDVWNWRKEIAA